ncbi:MAG TPA: hypothetical protein VEJ63_03635 [Planctomycetota bacterium]|nr:hypothetical protein [Planctomycetota bacterium]
MAADGAKSAAAPSRDEISAWIKDLSSEKQSVRDEAEKNLRKIADSSASAEALKAAAGSSDAETAVRSKRILKWYQIRGLVDPERMKQVEIVVRVKVSKYLHGDKHHWQEVAVLEVIQNLTDAEIKPGMTLQVSNLGWKKAMPAEECTAYLQDYRAAGTQKYYRLLNDSGDEGVSHVDKK